MEAEHLRAIDERQIVDVSLETSEVFNSWNIVSARLTEHVAIFQYVWCVELLESAEEAYSVPVVCHSSSVVDVSCHVEQGVPRDLFLLIKEHEQVGHGRFQIRVIELVSNVPPERAKLSPFLDNCMEEAQSEEQSLPLFRLLRAFEVLFRDILEALLQIGFQSSWRFGRQLDSILKN